MRKQTLNTKGFTLVELIIVITILAILGTIGFISFQGYTANARNTKRTQDLNSLSSKIEVKKAETAVSIMDFVVDAERYMTGISLAGTGNVSTGSTYNAGYVNFSLLDLVESNFQDPRGANYSIGATTYKDGKYQLAATIEGDNPKALIVGTYIGRVHTGAVVTNINDKVVELSDTSDIGRFFVGDTLSGATVGSEACSFSNLTIESISSNLRSLTLSESVTGNNDCGLILATEESDGLIGEWEGSNTGTTAIVNDGIDLPY